MSDSIDSVTGQKLSTRAYNGSALVSDLTQGFLAGKCYRAYKEFSANTVLKFSSAKPFLLTMQQLYLSAGAVRAVISVGGTPGGTFTALPTKFGRNGNVGAGPTQQVQVQQGGTITGGTEREVLLAASGAGVGIASVLPSPRSLPAGDYYITLTVTGTTAGIYVLEWEELF